MGFMSDGATMSWSDAQRVLAYVKEHGVRQFLAIYNDKKASTNSKLLWGDEVEYLLVRFDHARKRVALSLRGHDLLPPLQQPEHDDPATAACLWRPGTAVGRPAVCRAEQPDSCAGQSTAVL